MKEKKVYTTPTLIVYGKIEEITKGSGIGLQDIFVYGLGDVIGCVDPNKPLCWKPGS